MIRGHNFLAMDLTQVSKNFQYNSALYLPAISIIIAIPCEIYHPITERTTLRLISVNINKGYSLPEAGEDR